jgi:hypothetical protein
MNASRSLAGLFLAAVVSLAPATGAVSGEDFSLEMRPMMAISIIAGGKRLLSYFRKGSGACRLTLMIADGADEQRAQASRIEIFIQAGASAGFDGGDGKALSFGCTRSADGMIAARAK